SGSDPASSEIAPDELVVAAPAPQQPLPVNDLNLRAFPADQFLLLEKLDDPVGSSCGDPRSGNQLCGTPRIFEVEKHADHTGSGRTLQRSARSSRTSPRVPVSTAIRQEQSRLDHTHTNVACGIEVGEASVRQPFTDWRREVSRHHEANAPRRRTDVALQL